MRRLAPFEFASIALADLNPVERIGMCTATLVNCDDPNLAGALTDAANRIARHADKLERLFVEQSSGSLVGQCQPDNGHEPASGHFPSEDPVQQRGEVVRGAFQETPNDT